MQARRRNTHASGGVVSINVAANAADGNGSADGDFIYTMTVEAPPAAPARFNVNLPIRQHPAIR